MPNAAELDAISYPNDQLTKVIARLDLVSPIEALGSELDKRVSRVALQRFPIAEPRRRVEQKIHFSPADAHTEKKSFTQWTFHGKNREKELAIERQSVTIIYYKYERYEGLREDFLAVLNAFFESYDQAQPSRLGLRYINELRIQGENALDWGDYVDADLLGTFGYTIPGGQPTRIFHNLEFAFEDFALRFQFGLHNPDYPAPIRQRVFILDFDAYHKGLFEPAGIAAALDAYHHSIQQLFEQCITAGTRDVLEKGEGVDRPS